MTTKYVIKDTDKADCTYNILPVHIDYTGNVESGSKNWNDQLEKHDNTDELTRGWHGISKSDTDPKIKDNNTNSIYIGYLRGRRLLGKEHDLVKDVNYKIVTFKQQNDGIGGISDNKIYQSVGQGNKAVAFGHDTIPSSEDDEICRLEEWVKLSNNIHAD